MKPIKTWYKMIRGSYDKLADMRAFSDYLYMSLDRRNPTVEDWINVKIWSYEDFSYMRFRGRRLVKKPISKITDESEELESSQIDHEQERDSQRDVKGIRTERNIHTWGSICDESEKEEFVEELSIVEEESPDLIESEVSSLTNKDAVIEWGDSTPVQGDTSDRGLHSGSVLDQWSLELDVMEESYYPSDAEDYPSDEEEEIEKLLPISRFVLRMKFQNPKTQNAT